MIVCVSSTTILIPKDEKIWCGENTYGAHAHHMADTQEPTAARPHNNTQHTTKKNIKHHHHGPPKPPASSGFNFTGECGCHTPHNWSRSLQHGNVLFIDNTNFSFIYLTIILCAVAQRTHWLKVSFYRYILCFFLCRCIEMTRTNPSYLAIYYLAMLREKSSCFSLILDRGRGGAIVTMFSGSKR